MSGKTDPNEPCGTPDAVYGAVITRSTIKLTVEMNGALKALLRLNDDERTELLHRLHIGVLAAMEWLYETKWAETHAGKADGQGGVWPKDYFSIFERTTTGSTDGR